MRFRYTRHQVPRGTRADAEDYNRLLLVKKVSLLRVTYQIRLLAFRAVEIRKRLVIIVPKACRIDSSLRELMKQLPRTIRIERVD